MQPSNYDIDLIAFIEEPTVKQGINPTWYKIGNFIKLSH